jgi:hypothetical protein
VTLDLFGARAGRPGSSAPAGQEAPGSDVQLWAVCAAVVAFLLAVAVSLLAVNRASQGGRADAATVRAAWDKERESQAKKLEELASKLDEAAQRLERMERQLGLARSQAALLQAAAKTTKARTHLAEQNVGLAERDLSEADAVLQRALALAPDALKPGIEEVRRGLDRLKQSGETRTFPVAAVEMLADRIDDLAAAGLGP